MKNHVHVLSHFMETLLSVMGFRKLSVNSIIECLLYDRVFTSFFSINQ